MIKTENDSPEITRRIPDSEIKWKVFNSRQFFHKNTYNPDRFQSPNFETQLFIVDWQLEVDNNFDVEGLWY